MTRLANSLPFLLLFSLFLWAPALAQDETTEDEVPAEEEVERITVYVEMKPSFVTHVGEATQRPSYLKTDLTLRLSTETAEAAVTAHMPRLRHEIVMLLGEQTDLDALSDPGRQQALRDEARRRLNEVLEAQQTGEEITDVLFSTFVIQR